MTINKTRVRFAPSPTGMLHVGNARTALYNWLFARHTGGDFILRVEDTDVERSEARYEDQLIEDLRWLGLDWHEGPGIGGRHGPYRQSERLDIYRKHTDQLLEENKAYRCFCTGHDVVNACRAIEPAESKARAAAGEKYAVYLRIPDRPLRFHDVVRGEIEFASGTVEDFVLVRSGTEAEPGVPIYNYVVAVDDALMEITHVIRGDDHISNTPKQVAVFEAFGWPVPEFAHLSTILGADRERLSKRHGATSIASFREMGILPEALANYLALLGWGAADGKTEIFSLDELAKEFKLERVTASPAVFDFNKLNWLNRHYLKAASKERLADLAWPFFAEFPAEKSPQISKWFASLLALFLPAVDALQELPKKAAFLFGFDIQAAKSEPENAVALATQSAGKVFAAFRARVIAAQSAVTPEQFKAWMNEIKFETGAKGKELFHPVRILLTGAHSGPEFDKLIPLIEEGSALDLPVHILSVRERVERFFDPE